MSTRDELQSLWLSTRDRLQAKELWAHGEASLSLRIPDTDLMWFGVGSDAAPQLLPWRGPEAPGKAAGVHAVIHRRRGDVSAVFRGGGAFGACLSGFGVLPQVFDEQARHLGRMGQPVDRLGDLEGTLRTGGNVLLFRSQPICMGMTATRLALNAELFEKCAKAYVLAAASGARVRPLPWIVRFVANRRLSKDQRLALQRLQQGQLPTESKGY
ncbi:MAG TPA: hypothetical protein VFY35_12015 [Burkholderiaceae bacterium]|nr:hypothetical protein [Burkholderiaceae bacterium]